VVWFSALATNISSAVQSLQNGSGARPVTYAVRIAALSLWVKRLGGEVDHLSPSIAEVEKLYLYFTL
jgi:hypothetical protein